MLLQGTDDDIHHSKKNHDAVLRRIRPLGHGLVLRSLEKLEQHKAIFQYEKLSRS